MTDDRSTHSVLRELTDELKLQAWLARREIGEPSEHAVGLHEEASALARMRDTLRVQIHLGQMEARDEWERLEESWRTFMQRDFGPAAEGIAADAEEVTLDILRRIRDGYHRLLGDR